MWNNRIIVVLGICVLIYPATVRSAEARPGTVFMRQKLNFAQGVLEGLTLEKFDLIVTNASSLRDMSVTNAFTRLKNPEYEQKLTKFQARVERLIRAGKEQDIDKSFEAYSQVIESCFACHRQFRRQQFVSAQLQALNKRK